MPLAYVSGFVYSGGGVPLGEATVEIIDGEGTGRRAVTLVGNGSWTIEFLRLNAPFTARASKRGYSSEVKTHPGIVDNPLGYPFNSVLHFDLAPSAGLATRH